MASIESSLPMAFLLLLFGSFLSVSSAIGVRDGNGGNCIGVKSCRPRCITFRLGRSVNNCSSNEGIFVVESQLNPWNTNRFRMLNCEPAGTCINDKCGQELPGNLTIRIGEEGNSGSKFHTDLMLSEDEDRFTFCSVYPCPKHECAVPEQMGMELQLSIFPSSPESKELADSLLIIELYLKNDFVGLPLQKDSINRFGTLHVEWMDDPTGCREDLFSPNTPIAPLHNPLAEGNFSAFSPSLYCEGPPYESTPLPQTPSPTPTTTSSPTKAPAMTPSPTVAPTRSVVALLQIEGLTNFYDSTNMRNNVSTIFHNWFNVTDYCEFTGVECDTMGYVTGIELNNRGLSGSLPNSLDTLSNLRKLKAVGNAIAGSIPPGYSNLEQLSIIEISDNQISGTIPQELEALTKLRRFMVQNNNLQGVIPSSLCSISGLVAFDLSGNIDMHGEIPPCFGEFLSLNVLRMNGVGLVGEVPSGLCTIRPFNGLALNVLGCNAIACPSGFYEPLLGREMDFSTKCLPCSTPSNVIGSTTCVFVDENSVETLFPTESLLPSALSTDMPSTVKSFFPSLVPTSSLQPSTQLSTQPSTQPSMQPSIQPSTQPSFVPSVHLSSGPSLTVLRSMHPSSTPSALLSTAPSDTPSTIAPTLHPTTTPTTILPTSAHLIAEPTAMPDLIRNRKPSVHAPNEEGAVNTGIQNMYSVNWFLIAAAILLSLVAAGLALLVRGNHHTDHTQNAAGTGVASSLCSNESSGGWNSGCSQEETEDDFVNQVTRDNDYGQGDNGPDESVAPWTVLDDNNTEYDGDSANAEGANTVYEADCSLSCGHSATEQAISDETNQYAASYSEYGDALSWTPSNSESYIV